MENKNPMPIIDLFPRLTRAGKVIYRMLSHLPAEPLASHGDHLFEHAVGRAVMTHEITAEEGYQQLSFINERNCVIGRVPVAEWENNRWDDMGNYYDGNDPEAA